MCNCFATTLEKVKTKVAEGITDKIKENSLSIQWAGKVFRFDGKGNDVMLGINIEYRRVKESGEEYKNMAKDSISMEMTHCPFCGVKFND